MATDTPMRPSDQQIVYQIIIGKPLPDAEYESYEAVENTYRQHALDKGKRAVERGCFAAIDGANMAFSARVEASKRDELKETQLPISHCCD
jgi:hypothetical protein